MTSALRFWLIVLLIFLFSPQALCLYDDLWQVQQVQSDKYFRYDFIVDGEGNALVRIRFYARGEGRSSWVLVPRFSEWLNYTIKGRIYKWVLEDTERYAGSQYYFYSVLDFQFMPEGNEFEMLIEYNFSLAAMFVENESKYGIFYSPMIGFEGKSGFEAAVIFSKRFRANLDEALAIGKSSYRPDSKLSNSSFIFFRMMPAAENLLRIQVGFEVISGEPNLVTIESGIFKFNTVKRYEAHAWKILKLYNSTYETLIDIFNTTLEQYLPSGSRKNITVRFFVPDFNSLMAIGGYVPFSGRELGDIHLNIVFARYIEGYLEVIALHELIHHFLWKAGISPQNLLWFHEGMAQYISIEIASSLDYEGAKMIKDEIENRSKALRATLSDFSFLIDWTPSKAPKDLNTLYTAAYYVVSRLAEDYGGLKYYARFFRALNNKSIRDNAALCYYLSVAANESVANRLNALGFNVPDIYAYWPLINAIEKAIGEINPNSIILKPFKDIANIIYRVGTSSEGIFIEERYLILVAALIIARFAPLIALLTYSSLIFAALIILLKVKKVL